MYRTKKAFTMIELVFVVVIIGILASVAIPRLSATRDDAELTKGRTLLSAVRDSLSIERQQRILRGVFIPITGLGDSTNVFDTFWVGTPAVKTTTRVLEYAEPSRTAKSRWRYISKLETHFCLNSQCLDNNSSRIKFELSGGRFLCKAGPCSELGVVIE